MILFISLLFIPVTLLTASLIWFIQKNKIDEFELHRAKVQIIRFQELIKDDLHNLNSKIKDWAIWDDAYDYSSRPNKKFEKSNLDNLESTMLTLQINAMLFLDKQGRLLWNSGYDLKNKNAEQLPEEMFKYVGTIHQQALGKKISFQQIISTSKAPMLLTIESIFRTDGSGDPNGLIAIGQYLNNDKLASYAQILQGKVSVIDTKLYKSDSRYSQIEMSLAGENDSQKLHFDELDNDIEAFMPYVSGNERFLLRTVLDRSVQKISKRIFYIQSAAFFFVSLIFLGTLLLGMHFLILNPVNRIYEFLQSFKADTNYNLRFSPDGSDEIQYLGITFNELLKTIQDKQAQLLHSSKLASVGTMAAGIAHEINNPLAIASGVVDLIKKQAPLNQNPKLEEYFKMLQDSLKRIENIVGGLRTYARSDSELIENVNLHKVIEETLLLAKVLYKKSQIKIITNLTATNSIYRGNSGKTQQILINLMNNAKDAMEGQKTPKTITISTKNLEGKIVLQVSDSGPGITKDNLAKIFDPFFTTKEVGRGTGLGLSIIHSIVNAFGGSIAVDTQENLGTTFTIYLPEVHEGESIKEIFQISLSKIKGTCLLVDDEEQLRQILRIHLTDFGLQVMEAANGIDALDLVKKHKFDFIITDIQMPKMNGDIFIKMARKIGVQSKILIITGGILSEQSNETNELLEKYADGHIGKPINPEELHKTLVKVQT